MTPGEVSTITSTSQYAYDGRPDRPDTVPLGAMVEWEVELISFEKQQDWERAEPDVKIEHAGSAGISISIHTWFRLSSDTLQAQLVSRHSDVCESRQMMCIDRQLASLSEQ